MPQPGIPWVHSPHAGSHQLLEPGFSMQNLHPCPFRPPSVGKTSLLHQYVHKTFYEDYRTTLGASILTKVIAVDNTPLKMQVRCPATLIALPVPPGVPRCPLVYPCPSLPQIWDTGGQERFRSMVSTFYKGSDGCVLAFDVTDRESFESLDNWRADFLEKVIPRDHDFPMVVLGNKIDLCDRQVRWGGEHSARRGTPQCPHHGSDVAPSFPGIQGACLSLVQGKRHPLFRGQRQEQHQRRASFRDPRQASLNHGERRPTPLGVRVLRGCGWQRGPGGQTAPTDPPSASSNAEIYL